MKSLLLIVLLSACTKPQTLSGTWYSLENHDTAWVTFGALMTVEYKRAITETTYTESDSLTVHDGVMLFPRGTYGISFLPNQVTLSGPRTVLLNR